MQSLHRVASSTPVQTTPRSNVTETTRPVGLASAHRANDGIQNPLEALEVLVRNATELSPHAVVGNTSDSVHRVIDHHRHHSSVG